MSIKYLVQSSPNEKEIININENRFNVIILSKQGFKESNSLDPSNLCCFTTK